MEQDDKNSEEKKNIIADNSGDDIFNKKEATDADFDNLGSTDLSGEIPDSEDEIDEDEKLFLSSKSSASRVNVGSICAVFFIVVAAVVLVIILFTKLSGRNETKEDSLDYAGGKSAPKNYQLGRGNSASIAAAYDDDIYQDEELTDEEIDDILGSLPEEYQLPGTKNKSGASAAAGVVKQGEPGVSPIRQSEQDKTEKTAASPAAPAQAQGSAQTASQTSSQPQPGNQSQNVTATTAPEPAAFVMPDTRKSNSVRKIEGLGGFSASQAQGGTSSLPYLDPSQMTKQDYINQTLASMNAASVSSGTGSYAGNEQASIEQDKQNFYNNQGTGEAGTGRYLAKNTIWDGTIIKGALETGINTDNPGVVIARVTENVYSSYDYSYLLIPEGTLLYATYNSSVSYGQDRVQIAWNLLIRPDGYRMELGNMNGVDSEGYSGVEGWKYNHIWEELKALGLVAVYSILNTEITNDIKKEKNEFISNAMTDVYQSTQRIANGMVERALDIKPSITVAPGTEIKLITNQPLTLPAVEQFPVTQKYVRH